MRILPFYIARSYLVWFLIILVGLLSIIFIFDTIELMRRATAKPDITLSIILSMSFLNIPSMGQKILPFVALFASMLTLWRMTRTQELIIMRAVGVSIWQFLTPILLTTVLLGLFYLFAINPLGALMKKSYRELESRYIERSALLDLSSSGLWLRQNDGEKHYLLHADAVTTDPLTIKPLIAFVYDRNSAYLGRIDAEQAVLEKGQWAISNAWYNMVGKAPEKVEKSTLPTGLTMEKIQESMETPSTVSFWELPGFIAALEATGFPGILHRMQYQSLIAQPLFLCAMVLFAACFSLRMARRGGSFYASLAGLGLGSLAFGFNDVVLTLGTNQALPTLLAAFAVPLIAASAGAAALFHLEDG